MAALPEHLLDSSLHPDDATSNDQRLYLVPHRWWKDTQESSDSDGNKGIVYTATQGSLYGGPMRIINTLFNSDLSFNLRREQHSLQNCENGEASTSGRDFALVPGEMWLKALKWHSDSKAATKNGKGFSVGEHDMADVYPLQLRLSIFHEKNSLGVKISKKDNAVELFKRACKIFGDELELLRIWDFSGKTTLFFLNDKTKMGKECQRQSDEEILLELQVYGLSDSTKCRQGKRDDTSAFGASSLLMNCSNDSLNGNSTHAYSSSFSGRFCEAGSLGLTGLQNLGNTCFMNSAIQCLVHTPKLVDYFLGEYAKEINHENPLGMNGEIALAFGDLLRKLWVPGGTPVAPRIFKSKLARFAPQFSGFNQHDSQELLSFLLDGLHEDLNRVKHKPYVEAKDGDNRPDEEVADDYWRYHLARNDSIIVDICQGQYKSTLVCPACKKVSVTFDPFMYLSLPLPLTTMRTMTITVMSTNGSMKPCQHTVTVPKNGKSEDLIQALSHACSLGVDETLLVAEVYNNKIIRYLEEPADSLSLIRDADQLIAYQLTKDLQQVPLVVFMHQQEMRQYIHGKLTSSLKAFGVPLIGSSRDIVNGFDICNLYLSLLTPFRLPSESATKNDDISEKPVEIVAGLEEHFLPSVNGDVRHLSLESADSLSDLELEFYLTDEKGTVKHSRIDVNEPVNISGVTGRLNVLVCCPVKWGEQYDARLLNSFPEIFKSDNLQKRPQESVSLYKCLEAFLREEPLGPEDMWYCPGCKKHQQASKKLDLWRLPQILVIHLKRFSYSRFMKNKLGAYVDFPVDDFDLSTYIAHKNGCSTHSYMLYGISNHYGSMGGGHYTAFVHHGGDQWYEFDDSHVRPISQDKIKSAGAYLLFYRRVEHGKQQEEEESGN